MSQVFENAVDGLWFGDERDNPHLLATSRTRQRVNFQDFSQQLRPSVFGLSYCVWLGLHDHEQLNFSIAVSLAARSPLA